MRSYPVDRVPSCAGVAHRARRGSATHRGRNGRAIALARRQPALDNDTVHPLPSVVPHHRLRSPYRCTPKLTTTANHDLDNGGIYGIGTVVVTHFDELGLRQADSVPCGDHRSACPRS